MVILLVAMAVSAIWMGSLLPAWHQQATREREAELIFRGEQYARAIYLYRQRNNQTLPPNLDILVSQHYLRKKYKDPMTGKDFLPVGGVANATGAGIAGVSGVRSTSNDASIVVYRNQQTYSQFPFDWGTEAQRAGAGVTVVPTQPGTGGSRGATPGIGASRGGVQTGPGRGGQTGPGRGGVQAGRGPSSASDPTPPTGGRGGFVAPGPVGGRGQ